MSNGNWSMQLSGEMIERTKDLQREDQTPNDIMQQIYKLGLYQLEYRKNPTATAARKAYRERRAEEDKLARTLLKQAQSDPELAVKLGLGTRIAL